MPKRIGNLYNKCFELDNLFRAFYTSRRGKRSRPSVLEFEKDLGSNLLQLQNELKEGTYYIRPYKTFVVREPKERLISAPAFRDTVVQHAIYNQVYWLLDKTFIHDNYGCRKGKGTFAAADRVQQFMREVPPDSYILQLDIRKFYYSLDREILESILRRKIKDAKLVELIMQFAADPDSDKGVPIGSLLSQLLALVYMNPLDHFIKEQLKVKRYVRYVDDFLVFCDTRDEALLLKKQVECYLVQNLKLSFSKWRIAKVKTGVNFVGFRTWRKRRFIRKHSLYKFRKFLKRNQCRQITSSLAFAKRTSSYSGMLRQLQLMNEGNKHAV